MSQDIKILHVESDPYDAAVFKETLRRGTAIKADYEIHTTPYLTEAVDSLQKEHFDAIVLELGLPEGIGAQHIEVLKRQNPEVPVIVLTSMNYDGLCRQALQAGAQEIIQKSESSAYTLDRTICAAIFRQKLQSELYHDVTLENKDGLPNNLFIAEKIASFVKMAEMKKRSDALMLVKIPHLAQIYAEYGRRIGQDLAVKIAALLRKIIYTDFIGVLGEGSFIVYLKDNGYHDMQIQCKRLAEKIIKLCSQNFFINGEPIQAAVNLGVALYPEVGQTYNDLLGTAQRALCAAGENGISRYCIARRGFLKNTANRVFA